MFERGRALSFSEYRYISILVELTRLEGTKHGNLISLQVLDVAVRVESIRQFACHQMVSSLQGGLSRTELVGSRPFFWRTRMSSFSVRIPPAWQRCCTLRRGYAESSVRTYHHRLSRSRFIHAIYLCSELREPQKTLEAMLNTKIVLFPGHIQSVYYQNILKILTYLITTSEEHGIDSKALVSTAVEKMSVFLSSGDVEAQERVSSLFSRTDHHSLCTFDVGECDLAHS